jgi:Spy/CpxP family protein refolding chaperone
MKIKLAVVTIACIVAGLAALPIYAQGPGGGDEAKPMQKIQQFKKMKLLERLNMDEATADKFLVKYDKWEKQLMDLNHQRSILVQELHLALEKKAGDGEINSTLDSLIELTSQVDKTRHDMYTDLRTVLSPKQAAMLALFEARFQRELANSLNRMSHHGGMGGMGGGEHNWNDK